ncbi:MAG: CpaF family protein [Candidatus Eremiobacteraeota bacterium]|nr:CpaF family protein [Candidatus Eremiobacteraeota bacterium]
MTDRGYAKGFAPLNKYLVSVAAEPRLESLARPVETPIGDRRLERRGTSSASPDASPGLKNGRPAVDFNVKSKSRDSLKLAIHEALGKRIDLVKASQAHTDATKLRELRKKVEEATQAIIAEHHEIDSAEDLAQLKQEIINESLGFGPLEDLLQDPAVTEVMVNGPDHVFIERGGRIEQTSKCFTNGAQLRLIIERILAPLGRRIDESSPMVDARLADGSRVNAIIEPLAIDGATLTIRRFGTHRLQSDDLLRIGAVNQPILDFLRAAIEARLNICVSGGTGSGKTTFLNILSQYLPERERIITIEDAAELLLAQPHVVRLESRPANIEGHGEVRIRDLVRNSLRMRPDRIIVGECRGAEALDMLQAMNTGHDGSLTTVHANTARDALSRIETMVLMAGFDLPVRAIREQIASALDIVIQTSRLRDGSRKVTSISEVVGMEGEIVTMQELVRFAQHGVDKENIVRGEFQYTGVQPQCLRRFEEYGITYDPRGLATLTSPTALW